jgi:type IV secretion system protein VirB10
MKATPVALVLFGVVIAAASLAAEQAPAENAASAAAQNGPARIEVPSGTKLPLVLHNAISTRNAHPGDPVYLETVFPIVQDDKILIPAGSYVQGEITSARRPGRV